MDVTQKINRIYTSGLSSVLHAVIVPVFTFLFVIIYQPFNMTEYLHIGRLPFIAHLAILFSIELGCMSITRAVLFIGAHKYSISKRIYAMWCLFEIVFSALFCALYIGLSMRGESSFFNVIRITLGINFCINIFPFAILFFGLDSYLRNKEAEAAQEAEASSLVRFYDEYHKLKFIIASNAIVYIKSEDNYVQIHYLDQQKFKKHILRSSMRALEGTLAKHGLIRCHRSYIINPEYVSMLHKDTNGSLVAQFNQEGCEAIPVSKKYQDEVTKFL